jgi:hypothetical protein
MTKVVPDTRTRDWLIEVSKRKNIYLEGNILKLIDSEPGDEEFIEYIKKSIERDQDSRKRRLDITRQIQDRNRELLESEEENKKINRDLFDALQKAEDLRLEAEKAKDTAENDLDIIQKRTQFELTGLIVKVALYVIIGVGSLTSIMYAVALMSGVDTQVIGSTWSNMLGILLTNAFSIVGTIMGVKYASEKMKP